ncbi:polyprenyl diphosphate synthase [Borreliella yangtzensis]|uniref:Isoprenyl transferase n=1 Tax=Borreliella yangtzensis TaxID=683292 RepID=A0ABR6PA16_9SPIR|nr:polyprenyl diphosphate synthase [Borreliella yangtzensis]MBB6043122.1 undecaprenyl diphosphate synthase [Borreliella yangtzensis]WKC73114.1 polyprenyl diphosphate synthase [Borreliella yangtzensis]WKC74031.1 polyprenyl diphosphate synthase [Borreliella yangtzensis]
MNKNSLPRHVGIIMDGNRRWALGKGLSFLEGYKEGLKRAKEIVKHSLKVGIKYLSLYVFSTENWKRDDCEIEKLMFLIASYLRAEFNFYKKNGIKIIVSGDIESLSEEVKSSIKDSTSFSKNFSNLILNLAINYGGRNEILRAVRKFVSSDFDLESLDENAFSSFLDNPELPDLDLLIRTGGNIRISNFFLWRIAYSELIFSNVLWPEYYGNRYGKDLECFQFRIRNFGR